MNQPPYGSSSPPPNGELSYIPLYQSPEVPLCSPGLCCLSTVVLSGLFLLSIAGWAAIGTSLGLKFSGHKISTTAFRAGIGAGAATAAATTILAITYLGLACGAAHIAQRNKSGNYALYNDL